MDSEKASDVPLDRLELKPGEINRTTGRIILPTDQRGTKVGLRRPQVRSGFGHEDQAHEALHPEVAHPQPHPIVVPSSTPYPAWLPLALSCIALAVAVIGWGVAGSSSGEASETVQTLQKQMAAQQTSLEKLQQVSTSLSSEMQSLKTQSEEERRKIIELSARQQVLENMTVVVEQPATTLPASSSQ